MYNPTWLGRIICLMATNFVHLNVHTEYSLLSGACRLREPIEKAKAMGQTALAITDTAALYGAIDFADICHEVGIKPIIGCEVLIAENSRLVPQRPAFEPYRLTLLAENEKGYKNLCRIITEQVPRGSRFITDKDCLSKYAEGLIALSGGISGEIGKLILENRFSEAKKTAEQFSDMFRGNFYLELVNHDTESENRLCGGLRELSRHTGIPLCPTNNVHYTEKSGSFVQRILSCIGQNLKLTDPDPHGLPTEEYYLKSYSEMRRFFSEKELAATAEIAERCNFEFEFGKTKLPLFTKENVTDNVAYFRSLCRKGAEKRYGTITKEINDRLEYELSVIEKMGFADYFLIVWDFVRYAKTHDIPVGPGRGSGAGSLCAYCMGITEIDPLRFNLLFERFLNPERVSMPDFDIDFCNERREEVIEYVRRKYTPDHVAQIAAFDTLKARAALRDAGRVMGINPQTVDTAARSIASFKSTLQEELEIGELKKLYETDGDIKRLTDVALCIEGFPRHTTVHAAGVVITREPVYCYVPLQAENGGLTTQFTMTALERLGLLKMDFLGLRNLTLIKKTCDLIKLKQPDFDINKINDTDSEVYKMLGSGGTCGVFQFESEGMTSVLSRLKPASLEDLTAALALYRPGPMASIPLYIENRHKKPEEIEYKHPLLRDILSVTYGCIVYQEQVMQICRVVGGYSYGRADLVRRAMAKKKHSVMEQERSAFVYGTDSNCGAIANGVPENIANEIFDEMAQFASYAFNKSHAAAYSWVAYQTAYLRCHCYTEYMSMLISGVSDSTEKMTEYISDMKNHGIQLLPPDINHSFSDFTVEGESVRFGLSAVKNLSRGFADNAVKERKNGKFVSAADFAVRMAKYDNNRRYMEALVRCGAFDNIPPRNRHSIMQGMDELLEYANRDYKRKSEGQLDLFGSENSGNAGFEFPEIPEFGKARLLTMEQEAVGMYISGHPASVYLPNAYEDCMFIADALRKTGPVSLTALVTDNRLHNAKNGAMCFIRLEDESGETEGVIFSDILSKIGRIKTGEVYCLRGKITHRNQRTSFIADNAVPAQTLPVHTVRTLYVNLNSENDRRTGSVIAALNALKGVSQARICFADTRQVRRVNSIRGVRICDTLIKKLKAICGENNIIVK